jgi:tRNA-specific 2-thiouridylase
MKNWEDAEELGYCPGEKDWEDASVVANQIGIKLHRCDFVKEYWNEVFM